MKSENTTIKINKKTKDRLDGLKEYRRETYDDIIDKMLNIINITIKSPTRGARIYRNIKRKKNKKQQYQTEELEHEEYEQTQGKVASRKPLGVLDKEEE